MTDPSPESQKVLEAFKRFDQDGSGAISREELAAVLKKLEEWDTSSVDQLLANADTSGDGELQLQEFVRWIFAEDKSVSDGMSGFTLRVRGCSRTAFNGDYEPTGDFYFHRPVWSVFKTKKKKTFVKEPGMVCRLATPAELVEAAPDGFTWNPSIATTHGPRWYKQDELYCDRPVYQEKRGDKWSENNWMFFDASDSKWKRRRSVGDTSAGRVWETTLPTWAYTPDRAPWLNQFGHVITKKPSYVDRDGNELDPEKEQECFWCSGLFRERAVPEGWKDPDFPHSRESLQGLPEHFLDCRWIRAIGMSENPVLFNTVEPADAVQGALGDCWLIAAIAAVAEFPSYFKDHIFVTQEIPEDGKYEIKLFDPESKEWQIVTVDDYLPVHEIKAGTEKGKLKAFLAAVPDGQMSIALVEKAFAKLYGNYGKLEGGHATNAWLQLTGCDKTAWIQSQYNGAAVQWVVTSENGAYMRQEPRRDSPRVGRLEKGAHFEEVERVGSWIKFKKIDGEGPEEGYLFYYQNGKRVAERTTPLTWTVRGEGESRDMSSDDVWQRMMEYEKANYLVSTNMTNNRDESPCGMVKRHAYSLMHVMEIEGHKLVCSRNPHGLRGLEWNGPWSDMSEEWDEHPSIAKAVELESKFDGLFWMDWEDWQYVMGVLHVTKCDMGSKRGGFAVEIVEEDEEPEGAVIGCSGLDVAWNDPQTVTEGILVNPGDRDYTLQNIPQMLLGGTYWGTKPWPSAGTWTVEYTAPVKLYVWVMKKGTKYNAGVDEVLGADGWVAEDTSAPLLPLQRECDAAFFQRSDGPPLSVWSRSFQDGSSYEIQTNDLMVGGVIAFPE